MREGLSQGPQCHWCLSTKPSTFQTVASHFGEFLVNFQQQLQLFEDF